MTGPSPQELRDNLDEMSKNMEVMFDSFVMQAKLLKGYYDSLIEAGFNQIQALDIIKARGITT